MQGALRDGSRRLGRGRRGGRGVAGAAGLDERFDGLDFLPQGVGRRGPDDRHVLDAEIRIRPLEAVEKGRLMALPRGRGGGAGSGAYRDPFF
jgi:hypothetical protein